MKTVSMELSEYNMDLDNHYSNGFKEGLRQMVKLALTKDDSEFFCLLDEMELDKTLSEHIAKALDKQRPDYSMDDLPF